MKLKIEIDRHAVSNDWIVRVIGYDLHGVKGQVPITSGCHTDRVVAASFALVSFEREVKRLRTLLVDFGARDDAEMLATLDTYRTERREEKTARNVEADE